MLKSYAPAIQWDFDCINLIDTSQKIDAYLTGTNIQIEDILNFNFIVRDLF